jgi:hypothetical protein
VTTPPPPTSPAPSTPAPATLVPAGLRCAGLRCAHQVNPLGVSPSRVRLSWVLEGTGTGRTQRAYQVALAPDAARLARGDLWWDSGRVESPASADIAYAGRTLTHAAAMPGRCGCGTRTGPRPAGAIRRGWRSN